MLSSWILSIYILLLHLFSRGIHTTKAPPLFVPNSPPALLEKSVVLKGDNHVENIELLKPIDIKLDCTWTGGEAKLPNITGYWTKDGIEIANTRLTVQLENEQYNLKRLFSITKENTGNYSCVFAGLREKAKIDFNLEAPKMSDVRDKPVVSYVGDSVVLECKLKKTPLYWRWYILNGTEMDLINTEADSLRYKIYQNQAGHQSKLTVLQLTEADAGTYLCNATFDIGASVGRVELRVITFLEPLKPFLAILVEVVVLVILILLYEKRSSQRQSSNNTGNGIQTDQTNKLTQAENGMEESSTMRQRKV